MTIKIKNEIEPMLAKNLKVGDIFRFVTDKPEWATYMYVRTSDPIGADGDRQVVLINRTLEDDGKLDPIPLAVADPVSEII